MKIAVIEDDFLILKEAFNYLNIVYYENNLDVINFSRTQDIYPFELIYEFDVVFIDVSLHRKSESDGLSFLKRILNEKKPTKSLPKIGIITGANNIKERMNELEIGDIPILNKPLDFNDLRKIIG
ncbi:MAG: response regulator [Bacteroidota bacterium]